MRKHRLNKNERQRTEALNQMVSDAVALYNESAHCVNAWYEEAVQLARFINLRIIFNSGEVEFTWYTGLLQSLEETDAVWQRADAAVATVEHSIHLFSRRYSHLITVFGRAANSHGRSHVFSEMEVAVIDLFALALKVKEETDKRYALFYEFRRKTMVRELN